jgi:hypothetical protein
VRARALTIALPSMLGGVLVTHRLAYRLFVPDPALRAAGHGYLAHAPLVLALTFLAGFVVRVATPGAEPGRAWPFAVLPPAAFLLQEELEAFLHSGGPAAPNTVLVAGLLLAVPFGLVAYGLARGLSAVADRLGVALRARRRRLRPVSRPRPAALVSTLRPGAVALAHPGRGPPAAR